ncbi:hybrid sensor histidine kinase/response regulator [uncultured Sunxiuqinia sp.]|uniref:hybrid sensor histidine kinase/response regulator n=1 Tax=uncultured Sunxiuqinia sp. TaxID=1573825 RepID=UPI002AA73074|nr:hybrid sensor histidine kinase/response regulator [uncultured Sunxiuqinia sp.]
MEQKQSKILAVDDNHQNIKVIGSILRKANYQVGFAFDGQQALDLLKASNDYDLVLLDVNMPKMSGYETCIQIRRNPKLNEIPIIFLTALSEIDNVVEGFDSGAQDYVEKPFNSRELLARVETHIELKRRKEELRESNLRLEEKVMERTMALKKSNEKLKKVNQELQLLDEAKDDFLRIISHEINTPLNGVIGFINILKEELKNDEVYEMIHFLDLSAKRLEKFADLSLLITELRTNRKTLRFKDCHISGLFDVQIAALQESIQQKNISFDIDFKVDTLWADQFLAAKCVECILDNALRYSPENGAIRISSYEIANKVVCEVEDKGKGFSERILVDHFKFFTFGREYIDEQKGLSLALVNLIMKAHNGKIEILNSVDGGAMVRLFFPKK